MSEPTHSHVGLQDLLDCIPCKEETISHLANELQKVRAAWNTSDDKHLKYEESLESKLEIAREALKRVIAQRNNCFECGGGSAYHALAKDALARMDPK